MDPNDTYAVMCPFLRSAISNGSIEYPNHAQRQIQAGRRTAAKA
jgi:hypothetical protein